MSSIGQLLFNRLYIIFISAAFLLFIAMIGAIVLTMDEDLKKKKISNKNNDQRFSSINVNWKYNR
jgi:predicted RND superfamily exporter protein